MPALSEYSNVTNTIFNILDQKGYRIWHNEELEMYCAEKNGWDFMADSPSALLGLIGVYEFKQPQKYEEYWWKVDDKDLLDNLAKTKPEYKSIVHKK